MNNYKSIFAMFLFVFLCFIPLLPTYASETTISEPEFLIEDEILKSYNGSSSVVVIPSTVTKIEDKAFAENTTITSVTISEGVTEIGERVFQGCVNLSELNLPDSLKKIGFAALDGCNKLEKLVLPVGIQTMYTCIFADVEHMEYHTPGPEYAYFNNSAIKELVIMNPHFVEFTEDEPYSQWGPNPMSNWAESLVNIETIYGFLDCDAEKIADKTGCKFIQFEKSYTDIAENYSNELLYLGDINGDSKVASDDALEILRSVVGLRNELSLKRADMDNSGKVTVEDALQVLKCVVNLAEISILKPEPFETYQFSVNAKFQNLDIAAKKEYQIINSKQELDSFMENVYSVYMTKHNNVEFEKIKSFFSSFDEEFFNNNLCVVTLDTGNLGAGIYKVNAITNRDYENGEEIHKQRGLVMNYYLGKDNNKVEDAFIYILVSCTTISYEDLKEGELTHVSFREISSSKN